MKRLGKALIVAGGVYLALANVSNLFHYSFIIPGKPGRDLAYYLFDKGDKN